MTPSLLNQVLLKLKWLQSFFLHVSSSDCKSCPCSNALLDKDGEGVGEQGEGHEHYFFWVGGWASTLTCSWRVSPTVSAFTVP
jgi:hypothetical protein